MPQANFEGIAQTSIARTTAHINQYAALYGGDRGGNAFQPPTGKKILYG